MHVQMHLLSDSTGNTSNLTNFTGAQAIARVQHRSPMRNKRTMFECSFCGKRCMQKSDLKRHVRIHTGDKPYSCEICFKKFRLKHHVDFHMLSVHNVAPR